MGVVSAVSLPSSLPPLSEAQMKVLSNAWPCWPSAVLLPSEPHPHLHCGTAPWVFVNMLFSYDSENMNTTRQGVCIIINTCEFTVCTVSSLLSRLGIWSRYSLQKPKPQKCQVQVPGAPYFLNNSRLPAPIAGARSH